MPGDPIATIANILHCRPEEIEAIRLALKHKGDLAGMMAPPTPVPGLPSVSPDDEISVVLKQGVSVGAVWLLSLSARELGITAAFGNDRQGKLALPYWGLPPLMRTTFTPTSTA